MVIYWYISSVLIDLADKEHKTDRNLALKVCVHIAHAHNKIIQSLSRSVLYKTTDHFYLHKGKAAYIIQKQFVFFRN